MEIKNLEKIYFVPGNIVIIKHDIENRPKMLVTEIVTSSVCDLSYIKGFKSDTSRAPKQNSFKGIRCGWYDYYSVWHEHIFSTKDLIKVEEGS